MSDAGDQLYFDGDLARGGVLAEATVAWSGALLNLVFTASDMTQRNNLRIEIGKPVTLRTLPLTVAQEVEDKRRRTANNAAMMSNW